MHGWLQCPACTRTAASDQPGRTIDKGPQLKRHVVGLIFKPRAIRHKVVVYCVLQRMVKRSCVARTTTWSRWRWRPYGDSPERLQSDPVVCELSAHVVNAANKENLR